MCIREAIILRLSGLYVQTQQYLHSYRTPSVIQTRIAGAIEEDREKNFYGVKEWDGQRNEYLFKKKIHNCLIGKRLAL